MLVEIITSVFIIIGIAFIFSASFGLFRLPDAYCRMHATTKASTLGLINMLLASMIFFSLAPGVEKQHFVIQEILVIFFTFVSAPAGAHMLARTGYMIQIKMYDRTRVDELEGKHLPSLSENEL
ncbi:monovalent cation/H(+) antiporter subunit G [candidate division KSB1 bacterium]|nr:monovalent cation/H(+) antiporter subunit G [candidate division KSB1 bacterium]